jgi:hypothetical protein
VFEEDVDDEDDEDDPTLLTGGVETELLVGLLL